jgi:hypothetical protein
MPPCPKPGARCDRVAATRARPRFRTRSTRSPRKREEERASPRARESSARQDHRPRRPGAKPGPTPPNRTRTERLRGARVHLPHLRAVAGRPSGRRLGAVRRRAQRCARRIPRRAASRRRASAGRARQLTEAFTRADQFQESYKAAHPDYEAKIKAIDLSKYGVVVEDGVIVKVPHQFIGLQRLLLRAGEAGPGILDYLAEPANQAHLDRLLDKRTTPGRTCSKRGAKSSTPRRPRPSSRRNRLLVQPLNPPQPRRRLRAPEPVRPHR